MTDYLHLDNLPGSVILTDGVYMARSRAEIARKSYLKNREKILLKAKSHYTNNRTRIRQEQAKYNKLNRDKINTRIRNKIATDVEYCLSQLIRSRFKNAFKRDSKIGSAIESLGCSIAELKIYLESKFHPGMSWDNRGSNGWHIDHIKPLSSFNLQNLEQVKIACHYTNLQPLWAKDNLIKGDKAA